MQTEKNKLHHLILNSTRKLFIWYAHIKTQICLEWCYGVEIRISPCITFALRIFDLPRSRDLHIQGSKEKKETKKNNTLKLHFGQMTRRASLIMLKKCVITTCIFFKISLDPFSFIRLRRQ